MLPNGDIDVEGFHTALLAAEAETHRPSIIRMRSIIGWPSPKLQNTGKIHGSALGPAEVAATKEVLGFDPDKSLRGGTRGLGPHPPARRTGSGGT